MNWSVIIGIFGTLAGFALNVIRVCLDIADFGQHRPGLLARVGAVFFAVPRKRKI